jgi:DNA invertase Pin-like site-specific DNA recombinase
MSTQTAVSSTSTLTAREYLRVSFDRSGRLRSPDEQHGDHEYDAREHGWVLGTPYVDVGSASRYAAKARADFGNLLRDLETGRFGAHVLVLWEGSRGSRRVGEWVLLVDLCEERRVKIWVHTHERLYDPSNAHDRAALLDDAIKSELSSAETSKRAKRAAAANAKDGNPHGRTPFGYRRRYEYQTNEKGRQVRVVHQEEYTAEAELVRELFKRLEAGHSLRGIAKDWEVRGVVNKSGRPFTPAHLRTLATTRAYVGEREHTPGRKGSHSSPSRPPAQVVRGTWEPLVPRATFLTVQRILSAPERRTSRPGRAKHLLSMIARCGVCDGPVVATMRRTEPEYQCHHKGCVRVSKAAVDALAEKHILAFLSRPEAYAELAVAEDDGAEVAAIRDEIAALQARLDDLADAMAERKLSVQTGARTEAKILAKLDELRRREVEVSTPSRLRGLIPPDEHVRDYWKRAEMSAKREIVRIVLSADHLGVLCVLRHPTGGGKVVPAEQRVEFRRETGVFRLA